MATLRQAIEWIANNDDLDLGSEEDGYLISIYMAADLFDREPDAIARAVWRKRARKVVQTGPRPPASKARPA